MSTMQFSPRPTNNQQLPNGGPKFLRLPMDFTQSATLNFDLSNVTSRGYINLIQTIFVDNSANTRPLLIMFGSPVQQTLKIAAATQGYFPVLMPDNILSAYSDGNVAVSVALINVPIAPVQWGPASSNFLVDNNGYAKTVDQNLAGAIINNAVQVVDSNVEYAFRFNQSIIGKHVEIAAGATSATNLFGDASLTSYWLDGFDVSITPDATKAVAGLVNVQLVQTTSRTVVTGGTTLWSRKVYIPAAAANSPGVIEVGNARDINFFNNSGGAGYLHLVLDSALATGIVQINLMGGTTNITS